MSAVNTIPCPRAWADEHPCGEMTPDGLLCSRCTSALRHALREIPSAFKDLYLTLTRQSVTGGSGRRSQETPLVFDFDASLTVDDVAHTIIVWIGDLAERHGEDLYRRELVCHGHACVTVISWTPGRTMREWCGWLASRVHWIRAHPKVSQVFDELTYCLRVSLRTVDSPAEIEFAGTCDLCGHDLFARPGTAAAGKEVACRKCGEVAGPDGYVPYYDVADRRAWMRDEYRASLASAQEILLVCPSMFKVEINPGTFRSWVSRGLLVASGNGPAGPLYSVDRVLNLAALAADRSAKRNRPKSTTNTRAAV